MMAVVWRYFLPFVARFITMAIASLFECAAVKVAQAILVKLAKMRMACRLMISVNVPCLLGNCWTS